VGTYVIRAFGTIEGDCCAIERQCGIRTVDICGVKGSARVIDVCAVQSWIQTPTGAVLPQRADVFDWREERSI
jgi:hypothetical protein